MSDFFMKTISIPFVIAGLLIGKTWAMPGPNTPPMPPVSNIDSNQKISVVDVEFLQNVEQLLLSGALDSALEKRFDLIQERKKALRLAQKREAQRKKEASRIKAIDAHIPPPDSYIEPIKGNSDAAFSLIEYSDYGCPYCKKFHETAKDFNEKYGKYVNWVYRDLPLSIHEPYASTLAVGGRCIYKLGGNDAYWRYNDAVFSSQESKSGRTFVSRWASENDISVDDLNACMTNKSVLSLVEKSTKEAWKAEFTGTPSVILRNNLSGDIRFIPGAASMKTLEKHITEMANQHKNAMLNNGAVLNEKEQPHND
jgi:protein-disulfide isomerase